MAKPERFTNATGSPVPDNTNILTAGRRGPALLQDIWLIEKLAHFDREVIPERRMHAKGWGAYGTLTTTHDITKYTKAAIFSRIGKRTTMFARFSTVAGERGAADAERDIRGFALKFYTEDGNWDIVGNNTPVFFFRDPLRFSDLNHAIKRDPRTGLRSAQNNWDFWTLLPEALHQVTIVMSDRGIPKSFRHMHGFGSHTFSMINADNKRIWVKFHFRTQQGIQNLTDEAAAAVVANDRESNGRDLFEAIERGDFPRWTLFIQVMTEEQAKTHKHNPFDLTKVWPKADYPLIEVGVIELNRYPENYFAEVEQAAFSPANVVPGISFSPDKMLQGRLFSYGDTQRYRLGVNFNHIPVNAPQCPFQSYHRDGQMRTDGNLGRTTTYNPNSQGLWDDQPEYADVPLALEGDANHYDHRSEDDHWEQPGNLFRKMTPEQKQLLFDNTARAINGASQEVLERHVANCRRADPAYGEGLAQALKLKSFDGCLISVTKRGASVPHHSGAWIALYRRKENTIMTLEEARKIIAAAEKKAVEIKQPMNIAVVDEGGNLVSHVRMDGAWIGSIDISINKAFTSRAFDIATKDLAQHSQSGGQFFGIHVSNHGRIMIFAGGIPLKRGGKVVGAVGVSGGSGEQDQAVAQAAADSF